MSYRVVAVVRHNSYSFTLQCSNLTQLVAAIRAVLRVTWVGVVATRAHHVAARHAPCQGANDNHHPDDETPYEHRFDNERHWTTGHHGKPLPRQRFSHSIPQPLAGRRTIFDSATASSLDDSSPPRHKDTKSSNERTLWKMPALRLFDRLSRTTPDGIAFSDSPNRSSLCPGVLAVKCPGWLK